MSRKAIQEPHESMLLVQSHGPIPSMQGNLLATRRGLFSFFRCLLCWHLQSGSLARIREASGEVWKLKYIDGIIEA